MSRSALFWGAILIVFGTLFLLNNLNIIQVDLWVILGPAFLIILGLWILFGPILNKWKGTERLDLPLEDASQAHVRFAFGAGKLSVGAGAEDALLLNGEFSGGLSHHVRKQDKILHASLEMPSMTWPIFMAWPVYNPFQWKVKFNPRVPLELEADIGAAESVLDLSNLQVKSLRISTGVSSTSLTMPSSAGMTRALIKSGVASVKVQIPEGVAARIHSSAGLGAVNVDLKRFPKSGGVHLSPDYEQAVNKIDLSIETGLGTVDVR
jgi:hypothetical protein